MFNLQKLMKSVSLQNLPDGGAALQKQVDETSKRLKQIELTLGKIPVW